MPGLGERGRPLSEWREVGRSLLRGFLRAIPIYVGIWLVVSIGFVIWGVVSEEMPVRESLALALGFLPMAVPLSPLIWLRHEYFARQPAALPAVGVGCLWFLVTAPLAIWLGSFLAGLLGAE